MREEVILLEPSLKRLLLFRRAFAPVMFQNSKVEVNYTRTRKSITSLIFRNVYWDSYNSQAVPFCPEMFFLAVCTDTKMYCVDRTTLYSMTSQLSWLPSVFVEVPQNADHFGGDSATG